MPDTTPAAFISYSRDDQEFALRLAQDLKAAGAAVWLDQLDIEPGQTWDNAVEDALIAAPRMLLVLSPGSSRSANVRNEISFALEQGKIVIPVLYRDCIVPLQLQRNNRIDFRADYARGIAQLLAHLNVPHPNQAVLDKAAEDDARRQAAWHAREAEAERLRKIEEQAQQAGAERVAQQESLRKDQEAEARRQAAEQQRKAEAAEAQRRSELEQQQKAEAERVTAEAEAQHRRELEQQQKAEAERRAAQSAPQPAAPPIPAPPPASQRPAAPAPISPQRPPAVHPTPPSIQRPAPRAGLNKLWLWLGGGAAAAFVLLLIVLFLIGISTATSKNPDSPPASDSAHAPAAPAVKDALPAPDPATAATAKSQVDKGLALAKSKHYSQALALFSAACDAGNPDGCDYLGLMYQQRLGVAQDYPRAIALYTRVCDSGNANGCGLLARIHHEILFDFDAALAADQKTLRLDASIGNSMNLLEAYLTAEHFNDCTDLAAKLNPPALTASEVVIRDTIKLACQAGEDHEAEGRETAKLLATEAKNAKAGAWDFTGTLHYLQTSSDFATNRSAWVALFTAVQNGNPAGIGTALTTIQAELD